MSAPVSAEKEITLDELVTHWGAQRASDVGQETLNRLEELQRARVQIEELRAEIKALHQERRSFQAGRISYRGFSYGVGSQWGIDSLRQAIEGNGHG
jgi:hypothetical protein